MFKIFKYYSLDTGTTRDKIILSKFKSFLKDFDLLNEFVTLERVQVMYAKRCPVKTIDFPAFIDIIYKISKLYDINADDRNMRYQIFLDEYFMAKYEDILESKSSQSKLDNIKVFGREYIPENESLRVLEGHDNLLRHVFIII